MREADSVQAFTCDDPKCKCVHLRLCGKDGKAFAEATLTPTIIKHLYNTLYALILEKD